MMTQEMIQVEGFLLFRSPRILVQCVWEKADVELLDKVMHQWNIVYYSRQSFFNWKNV